ncbi:MAG: UDP-2,4-diacetamido-2,4,6-trideoxy-beta-L-altropyranose hydrolase [Eubacterium sp.]|nr:UDP-2,4-diacetamido-2,4,6-trideoxy-beta-L-altropyranose hydrolase [Eubacterium sp.]
MQKMLYIRVDMNQTIATGHVMRCLSIAEAAKDNGVDVTFILADDQAEKLIQSKGFRTIVLNSIWNDLEKEMSDLLDLIAREKIETLLVDSYYVTEKYLETLNHATGVAYIDDLNSFHYPVDTLIAYANYWKKMNYEDNYPDTKLLLGCSYVPLRKEFQNLPPKVIRENVENLLILTGGSDNFGISENILEHILLEQYKNINVICGRYFERFDCLKSKYHSYGNVHLHQAVDNILDYMLDADVAISAGGTTLYELCATGTPTITYSFADNQLDNVKQFEEDGIMRYAGDVRYDEVYEYIRTIIESYQEKSYRNHISDKMKQLIDGQGAQKLIREFLNLTK